jgi:hypothetical protein
VNRIDKLALSITDINRVQQYADFNKLMNAFVLRIVFFDSLGKCVCKVTVQIFLATNSAMCFTSNFSVHKFQKLFFLLERKYGVKVRRCTLCTTVWTYSLLSKIGDLGSFYSYMLTKHKNLEIEFNPELFPCLTLVVKNPNHHPTFVRIFHTGKVVLLGVRCVQQVANSVLFLSDLFFDFSLDCNLENF